MGVITVVGGGFAGVEAAWAAARLGVPVRLYEMRPGKSTPAHKTAHLAELVCSNSFKSASPASPAGLLKTEMDALGSLVLEVARETSVPGGEALCVDRDAFGAEITRRIESERLIEIVREEFLPEMAKSALGEGPLILAGGPLCSEPLSEWLAELTGRQHLYFYDAVSPVVDASTVDRDVVFSQNRYDKGGEDGYLNCPFDRDTYGAFVAALVSAERAPIHAFEAGGVRESPDARCPTAEAAFLEKVKYFAGCTPIEAIAEKGQRSLAFGNFKPVGLTDPRTGRRPFAALQLRPENRERTLYSLVACQTRLRWGDQRRVFRMVPGLENAEFVRYGVIHRNTYVEAPKCLEPSLRLRGTEAIFLAGQLTGVEGYVESAAMGILSGLNAARTVLGLGTPAPPRASAYGSLLSHLADDTQREFAPMNINWGLFPEPEEPCRDKGVRRAVKLEDATRAFQAWLHALS
jgi:methylenetetrahydrofolate--tRNA-(uracil-5-)-methyltransferase